MKSGAISSWTDEDQVQIWGSHSSSTNNHLHYLLLVCDGNVNIFSVCHSRKVNAATWFLVLPIDIENPYRLSRVWYTYTYIERYMSSFWHHILAISPAICRNGSSKFNGWTIIEELSIRRRLRTFMISWGQKTRVKHCYVNLSSWCEFWFAIICIDINIILNCSTAIQQF